MKRIFVLVCLLITVSNVYGSKTPEEKFLKHQHSFERFLNKMLNKSKKTIRSINFYYWDRLDSHLKALHKAALKAKHAGVEVKAGLKISTEPESFLLTEVLNTEYHPFKNLKNCLKCSESYEIEALLKNLSAIEFKPLERP